MKPTSAPLFEHLDVLDELPPRAGTLNMALDEVLLHRLGSRPLLRLYRWEQPTVSFGYFEPHAEVAQRFAGRELVRRWTGGGVVEHGADFTYSLLVPRLHPITNLRAGESYRLIHAAVAEAFARLGWGTPALSDGTERLPAAALRACFAQPVQYDLLAGGRKVGGAAQRRTRAGLLHQGSVQWEAADATEVSRLAAVLPETLAVHPAARSLQPEELQPARSLVASRYAAPAWLRRC